MPKEFERRKEDVNVAALGDRVKGVEGWCERMDFELRANTVLTKQIHANTEEMVDLFKSSKEMFEFLAKWGKRFAVFVKYVGYVAGGITAVWALLNIKR